MNWTKMTTLTYLYLLWISGNYTLSVRVVFFENLDKFNCWKTTDIKLIREIIISEKLNMQILIQIFSNMLSSSMTTIVEIILKKVTHQMTLVEIILKEIITFSDDFSWISF